MSAARRPLDEHEIRRALRLDADELPPRLDPALIAAAARPEAEGTRRLVVVAAVAFAAGWVWSEAFRALAAGAIAATGIDPLATLIGLLTAALVRVGPIAEAATAPTIPLAILAAAILAALFERGAGTHAASS